MAGRAFGLAHSLPAEMRSGIPIRGQLLPLALERPTEKSSGAVRVQVRANAALWNSITSLSAIP